MPSVAIPIVEIVVIPLPMNKPTNEQTMKTDGAKNLTLINLNPQNIFIYGLYSFDTDEIRKKCRLSKDEAFSICFVDTDKELTSTFKVIPHKNN